MSEMSLYEQIKAINEMIQYIEETLPTDIRCLNDEVEDAVMAFRQNGRTDIADHIKGKHLANVNQNFEELLDNLRRRDLDYLCSIKEKLEQALNE